MITGPSGGALGDNRGLVSRDLILKYPDLAREFVAIGRYPRAGHDRRRWESVNWGDYRARVRPGRSCGPWHTEVVSSAADDPGAILSNWVTEAEGLPLTPPGWNMALYHAERGLVMSDVPAEIAGALPFLDTVAWWSPGHRVLIAGLGLGIVPAWLLAKTGVSRIDVVEIDRDVIDLITGDRDQRFAPNSWAADPRLHIHHGDAHTWWPGRQPRRGCCLHTDCVLWPNSRWQAAFFDIWDLVTPANLPSMQRLTRHYARRLYRMWSWERPECEAMRRRGQTLDRPYCYVDEDGYPAVEPEEAHRG